MEENLPVGTPHYPYRLQEEGEQIRKDVLRALDIGLPLNDAFGFAGVAYERFNKWFNWYKEDVMNGHSDTPLIDLFEEALQKDKEYSLKVHKAMSDKALNDGDTRMLMYIADNRLEYANRRKSNVEIGSTGEKNIQINIIDMKGVDVLEESDVEEIDVYGEVCGDDSDPAEMD